MSLIGLFLTMIYFNLVFEGQLPDHYLIYGWNDFILHTGAFGLLSILALTATGRRMLTLVILSGIALLFEGAQIFVPNREVSLLDLAANFLGVFMAALLVIYVRYLHRQAQQPEPTSD